MKISLGEALNKYGEIKNGKWTNESFFCSSFEPPAGLNWINSLTGGPVKHIYANRDMIPSLFNALENILHRGLSNELKTFDGCFMVRDVRAEPGHPSCHSYALAIDLNASENRLGEAPKLSQELVKCFTDEGFSWGGNFHRKDGMHFSYAWE